MAVVGSTGYNAKQGNWQVSTTATPNPAVVSDWITIPVSGLTTTSALIFAADRQIRFVPQLILTAHLERYKYAWLTQMQS